jgi:diguanylate cyclase (GGDEF)-like protein
METFAPAQLLCTAVLALAATALSAFDLGRGAAHRGFRWWTGALWLNAFASGLLALQPEGGNTALLQLLLVPWPVLCLLGLRRFHARNPLPGNANRDLALLAALLLAGGFGSHLPGAAAMGPLAPLWAASGAALYAAAVVWPTAPRPDSGGLFTLGALWLALALLPPLAQAWVPEWPPAALHGGAATLASLAMAFVVLTTSSQRTERELRQSRQRLRVLANIDMLTQVPNRRRFEELARRALLADDDGSATFLLVDIDHFKQINDQLGHAAGDRALRLVSRCTLELLRAQDVVGRHGGDEFVMLLRRSSTRDAMQVAQRLVSQIQLRAPAHALPSLSLSFGIVQMRQGEGIDQTLLRADQALYEAKRLGRARAVAADGDPDRPVFRSSQRLGLTPS